jgi:hypothetical protein
MLNLKSVQLTSIEEIEKFSFSCLHALEQWYRRLLSTAVGRLRAAKNFLYCSETLIVRRNLPPRENYPLINAQYIFQQNNVPVVVNMTKHRTYVAREKN